MSKTFHIIGNGDKAVTYKLMNDPAGKKLICNMPPFEVKDVMATCMVDFKMMMALTEGSIKLDSYDWVLGNRPKIWMENRHAFYLKYAQNVKEFYLTVPDYCGTPGSAEAATNFNCGHMAVHYAANRHKAKEIHLYGFDTLFDFNMRSVTDLYLQSDRSDTNNYRLINNWRPIWRNLFLEFPDTRFVLHHDHSDLKIPAQGLDNLTIMVHNNLKTGKPNKEPAPPKEKVSLENMNRKQRRAHEAMLRKGLV